MNESPVRFEIRARPFLNKKTEMVESLHPEIDAMSINDAFRLIANHIGFEYSIDEDVIVVLNRAERYLRTKGEAV